MIASDYLLSISNFTNPLNKNAASMSYQIYKSQYSIIDLAFQKVRVTTDSGYLLENLHFEDQLSIQSVDYHNIIRGSSTDPQLLLRITPFHKRLTYKVFQQRRNFQLIGAFHHWRYYPKLLVLVGLIGGILKSLMVLGSFVREPFSKLSMRTELVNQLFTFEIKSDPYHNKANIVLKIKEPLHLPREKSQQIHKQSYDSTLKHPSKQDQEESDSIQDLEQNYEYFNASNHQQPTNLINPTAYTNGTSLKLINNAAIFSEISSQRPFIKTLQNKELDSVIELEEFGASEMYIPSPMKVPVLCSPLRRLTPASRNSSSVPLESYRLSKIEQETKTSSQKQLSTNQLLNSSKTPKQLKSQQDCLQSEGVLLSGQINTLTGDTGNFDQPESEDPDKPSESENFNHNESSNNTNNTRDNQQNRSKTNSRSKSREIKETKKDFFPFELDHVCAFSNNIESQIISINNMIQQQSQVQNAQNQEIIPSIPLNVSDPIFTSQQEIIN